MINRPARIVSLVALSLLLLAATLALFASLVSAAPAGPQALCTVKAGGGGDYTTIAGALADSTCNPIEISAGTYYENVTIDRDVVISGAGATGTIVDGNGTVTSQRVISITLDEHVSISDLTIRNGLAITPAHGGGGIMCQGYLTLTNVILANNTASGTEDNDIGGAISPGGVGDRRLVLASCILSHNTARRGGGILYNGTLVISNTLVYSNSAFSGGGLTNYGPASLTNVTFSGNHASGGGAAIRNSAGLSMVNCTVADNAAPYALSGGGTITAANTLLARNGLGNCSVSLVSLGNNLEDSDDCGLTDASDITETVPLLGSLADNGGFSWTHALRGGSRGIDEGGAALCPPADQRGEARPIDGDGDGLAVCDIGAFEYYPTVFLPLVLRTY